MEEQFEKGIDKGKIEGKIEVARNMKAAGIAVELIVQTTGLSQDEIVELRP